MKLLVGCDPEIFLKDSKTGKHVSAHDIVPGTKKKPYPVKKGAVQHDGVALEINIDPASSADEFQDTLTTVLKEARELVPSNLEFDYTPAVEFDRTYFNSLPEDVRTLGCDPDYNAISGERNRIPDRERLGMPSLCTGAGHLALGWTKDADVFDEEHFWDCQQISLRLDKYFQSTKLLWDLDNTRHNLYGANAAFRPKPFGVEYRSLSNAWLGRPELWPWIFDSAKFVFDHAVAGKKTYKVRGVNPFAYFAKGYDRNYRMIQGFQYPADQRIALLNPFIKSIYGDDPPALPKTFVPVEYPENPIFYRH